MVLGVNRGVNRAWAAHHCVRYVSGFPRDCSADVGECGAGVNVDGDQNLLSRCVLHVDTLHAWDNGVGRGKSFMPGKEPRARRPGERVDLHLYLEERVVTTTGARVGSCHATLLVWDV